MSARVLRWTVPIDDQPHEVGGGNVVLVDQRPADGPYEISLWTLELPTTPALTRRVRVFGTGQPVDVRNSHLGSTVARNSHLVLVWHLFEVGDDL